MLQPRPGLEKIKTATHGGLDYAELRKLGIAPEKVLDFSVSTNPFGPPLGIEEALAKAAIDRYPDSESTGLKSMLAEKLHIAPGNIAVGSGSTELIRLAVGAYFSPGDSALIPQPTYDEYELAVQIAGGRVIRQVVSAEAGFRLDAVEAAGIIAREKPRGVFICNPNNPTGQYLSRREVERILNAAENSLVVLDEAYIAFTPDAWSSFDLLGHRNLAIVRSMTKDYALAGLRLGYVVASEQIIDAIKRLKPPWNVSSLAQVAGIHVLHNDSYLADCCKRTMEAKEFLIKGLRKMGLAPLSSQTNFFLAKVANAAGLRRALLEKGILVRNCASFGLNEYIRLAPRPLDDCRRLLAVLQEPEVSRYAR